MAKVFAGISETLAISVIGPELRIILHDARIISEIVLR